MAREWIAPNDRTTPRIWMEWGIDTWMCAMDLSTTRAAALALCLTGFATKALAID